MKKQYLLFPLMLAFISCVGTVNDKTDDIVYSTAFQTDDIKFSGALNAESECSTRVRVWFSPATGGSGKFAYRVYANGSPNVSASGTDSTLKPNIDQNGRYSMVIDGLERGQVYSFNVKAFDIENNSEDTNSKIATATTISTETPCFGGISSIENPAGIAGRTSLKLNWNEAESSGSSGFIFGFDPKEVTGYRIYKGVSPDDLVLETTVNGKEKTSKTISNLVENTTYYFKVTAIDGQTPAVEDENQKVLFKKTLSPDPIVFDGISSLSTPKDRSGYSSLSISWTPGKGDFDRYIVFYSKDKTFNSINVNEALADNNIQRSIISDTATDGHTLTGLLPHQVYSVAVAACPNASCTNTNSEPDHQGGGIALSSRTTPPVVQFEGISTITQPLGTAGLTALTLNWSLPDTSAGVYDGFVLYKSNPDGSNMVEITNDDSGGKAYFSSPYPITKFYTSVTVENLTRDQEACFILRAVSRTPADPNDATPRLSQPLSIKCSTPSYSLPGFDSSSIACDNPTVEGFRVSWNSPNPAGIFDSFEIILTKNTVFEVDDALLDANRNNGESDGYKVVFSPNSQTSKVITGLEPGTNYNFLIKTYFNTGQEILRDLNTDIKSCKTEEIKANFNGWLDVVSLGPRIDGTIMHEEHPAKNLQANPGDADSVPENVDYTLYLQKNNNMWNKHLQKWVVPERYMTTPYGLEHNGKKGTLVEKLLPTQYKSYGNIHKVEPYRFALAGTANNTVGTLPDLTSRGIDRPGRPRPAISQSEVLQNTAGINGFVYLRWQDFTLTDDSIASMLNLHSKPNTQVDRNKIGYNVYRLDFDQTNPSHINGNRPPIDSSQPGYRAWTLLNDTAIKAPENTDNSVVLPRNGTSSLPANSIVSTYPDFAEFVDYSVTQAGKGAGADDDYKAKIYWYRVQAINDGKLLNFSSQPKDLIIKVILPPPNLALVHRWMANRHVCEEMGKTIDRDLNYACQYDGMGARNLKGDGQGYYDILGHQLVMRWQLGAKMYHEACDYSAIKDDPNFYIPSLNENLKNGIKKNNCMFFNSNADATLSGISVKTIHSAQTKAPRDTNIIYFQKSSNTNFWNPNIYFNDTPEGQPPSSSWKNIAYLDQSTKLFESTIPPYNSVMSPVGKGIGKKISSFDSNLTPLTVRSKEQAIAYCANFKVPIEGTQIQSPMRLLTKKERTAITRMQRDISEHALLASTRGLQDEYYGMIRKTEGACDNGHLNIVHTYGGGLVYSMKIKPSQIDYASHLYLSYNTNANGLMYLPTGSFRRGILAPGGKDNLGGSTELCVSRFGIQDLTGSSAEFLLDTFSCGDASSSCSPFYKNDTTPLTSVDIYGASDQNFIEESMLMDWQNDYQDFKNPGIYYEFRHESQGATSFGATIPNAAYSEAPEALTYYRIGDTTNIGPAEYWNIPLHLPMNNCSSYNCGQDNILATFWDGVTKGLLAEIPEYRVYSDKDTPRGSMTKSRSYIPNPLQDYSSQLFSFIAGSAVRNARNDFVSMDEFSLVDNFYAPGSNDWDGKKRAGIRCTTRLLPPKNISTNEPDYTLTD